MRRITDCTATIAALLAISAAVTIKAEISPLSFQGSAVTSRTDWFAAAGARDGKPVNRRTEAEKSEAINR